MKKRRTIAVVVVCAALVVGGAAVWMNWKWIAYQEIDLELGMTGYHKRWTWLPGGDCWFPDQICMSCTIDEHEHQWVGEEDILGTAIGPLCFIEPLTELADSGDPDSPEFFETVKLEAARRRPLLSLCICQQFFPGRKAR